ncbi:MAG: TonB-dependent receptor [Bacteroidales bacterium]|nr:TonB-dependent receptor [Bacteroidales bacterium]
MIRNLFLLFLFFPLFAVTQNSCKISGVVSDKTETSLSGANVFIVELKKGSSTNENGEFSIDEFNDGKYTLKISHLGYLPERIDLEVNGENLFLKIKLNKKNLTLDDVTIIADKYEYVKKIPSRIKVIPVEKIENSSEQNMADILSNISGVNVDNTLGIFSSHAVVSLRGLSGTDQSRTLVLIDDIPLNKSDGGSVNWNLINNENIEAIKIIKGPGSAKYGSNAMGGVINVITKKPIKKFSGNIKTSYGTYNTFSGSMNLSGIVNSKNGDSFYWNIMGSAKKSDGYITELDEYIEVNDSIIVPVFLDEVGSSLKLAYLFNEKHSIEFFANFFDDKRGNGIKVFDDYGAFSEHDTWFSVLKYKYKNKNFNLKSDFFMLDEHYQRIYEYMKEGEYLLYDVDSKRHELGANLDFTLTKNKHTFSSGIMYKHGSVDATDTYYTSTDLISNAGKMNIYALYFQDEIDFKSKNIQINIGLRLDFADFNDGLFSVKYPSYSIEFMTDFQDTVINPHFWNSISPKLSIQKWFNDQTRVYFSYGKGFKAPLLDDMCRTSKKRNSFRLSNPELKPETVDNFEIGVDYSIFKNLTIKQSAYYSIGKDFMYIISTGDSVNMGYKISPIYIIDNISKVHIYGLETDLEYQLNESFAGYLNYTYNISQIKKFKTKDSEADEDLNNKYLTNIPNHKLAAGLIWKNRIANISLSAKYIGSRWINDLNEVDDEYLHTDKFSAYVICNAKLKHEFYTGFSVVVNLNNIFDKIYINNRFQRCPGRYISGQIIYKF